MINRRGQVVGILTFRINGGESLNFVVPANYARGLSVVNDNLQLAELNARLPASNTLAEGKASEPNEARRRPAVALGPAEHGDVETHALIYVYRDSGFAGRMFDPPVQLDDVELVRMDNKRYFSVWASAGTHAIDAGGGSTTSCRQPAGGEFEAGHVYYFRMELIGLNCFTLANRNPDVAKKEMAKLKTLNPSNVKHPSVRLQ